MRLSAAVLALTLPLCASELESARDAQDRAALQRLIGDLTAAAQKQPDDPAAQYRLALGKSYLAEVQTELRDKNGARGTAEEGIAAAQKAVEKKPQTAEYHRVLGVLCGQAVSANSLSGLKYGRCAMDEVNEALKLDPKSAEVHLSRGVGNYYLPTQFGGGVDQAIRDFQKALELNPKLGDAYLWLGIALRKANRPAEAHQALEKAVSLNPRRVWAKQQLEKTPAK